MTTAADDSVRHIVIPACEEHAGFSAMHADVPWHCIYCGANPSWASPSMDHAVLA